MECVLFIRTSILEYCSEPTYPARLKEALQVKYDPIFFPIQCRRADCLQTKQKYASQIQFNLLIQTIIGIEVQTIDAARTLAR